MLQLKLSPAHACRPAKIPLPLSGIALNIIGGVALLRQLERRLASWRGVADTLRWPLVVLSLALQLLFVLRLTASWRTSSGRREFLLAQELQSPRALSSYGALLIASQLSFAQLHARSPGAAAAVHAASVLQYIVCALFLLRCATAREGPAPFWFPATVSLATPAIVGPAIGTPLELQYIALGFGVATTVCCWPPCVWRMLCRRPDAGEHIACDPSIFVSMAPVAFVSLGAFSVMAGQGIVHDAHAPEELRPVVKLMALANFASFNLTLLAALQRVPSLRQALWPFSPAWAGLTFPLVSNCTVAVLLANYYSSKHCLLQCTAWSPFTDIWARILVATTLVLIPLVDLAWILHLPTWWCFHPL
ncbi:hypothetical protein AB1Y20_001106 [Prymnesium parvum]|uniref:Uncharacterized protein n=1 Tax=Prymnesium parvum TaxID=97485 RepID=A0AB34K7B1_PRYPA